MSLHDLLRHPRAVALGCALLHSLWQLTLVAGLLASVNALLRRRSAQARYLSATGALLLMVLLPVATLLIAKGTRSAPAVSIVNPRYAFAADAWASFCTACSAWTGRSANGPIP